MTYKQWIIAAVLLAGPTALGGLYLYPDGTIHAEEGPVITSEVMPYEAGSGLFNPDFFDLGGSFDDAVITEWQNPTIIAYDEYWSFDSNGNWAYSDYNSDLTTLIKRIFGFTDSQVRKLLEGDTPKVPEPATLSLVGLGALALLRKRK
ncbi:MAG TPA: PEP-CTERM sorting domain-containing protein [Anaerohalosphaeraceae bacterium]|nr:PEP-CTERM sorting domain-containing protein [Anaerohalosphaeraceae bacterium]